MAYDSPITTAITDRDATIARLTADLAEQTRRAEKAEAERDEARESQKRCVKKKLLKKGGA